MNYADGALSPSDVALLTNRNGNGNDDFGYGGAWIIIFLIFAIFGWNGNGFGNRGNNGNGSQGSGAMDNYVLASDFATIQRQLSDGFGDLTSQTRFIQNGLCDGFYSQAQLVNGVNSNIASSTASIQQSLCQGFNGINQGITTNGYETRNAIQGVASQLSSCCCDIRQQIADCCCRTQSAIQDVNYNLATNSCAITNTINNGVRDLIDNQNANYRALHDEIVANRIEDKNAQIQAQQNEINALRLSASQSAQNTYLIDQLKPCASPAYLVPNPNCCYGNAYANAYNGSCSGCGY